MFHQLCDGYNHTFQLQSVYMSQPLRHIINSFVIVIATIALAAQCGCGSDETQSISGYGWIHLRTRVENIRDAQPTGPLSLTIATADGSFSGFWNNADSLSIYETFQVGPYIATATSGTPGAEGYGCQCYQGSVEYNVIDGESVPVELSCTLTQALARVNTATLTDQYAIDGVALHTSGHGYNEVAIDSRSPLLITPGSTTCLIRLVRNDGASMTLAMPNQIKTEAATPVQIDITGHDEKIEVKASGSSQEFTLSHEIWEGSAPIITTQGFESGVPISLIEGYPSVKPIVMDIVSSAPLQKVTLTLKGKYLADQDVPGYCDLLDLPEHLVNMGLTSTLNSDGSLSVDFTRLIESLNVEFNDLMEFSVQAVDAVGRASDIAKLVFTILSVDVEALSVTPAVLGDNYATVTFALSVDQVEEDDFTAYVDENGTLLPIDVDLLHIDSDKKIATAGFMVPEGLNPVQMVIKYMDLPKLKFNVPRQVPDFNADIDAFAHSAIVSISAVDRSKAEAICKYANVYANGQRTTILQRDIDNSRLKVIGLEPSCGYDIVVEVLPDQFAAVAKTLTEADAGVPMGDFEDFEFTYDFKKIPSGGPYSSAAFPIYNNQNFTDFSGTWVTKYWASVNDKTLCKQAKMHNTWYMQPSAWLDFDDYASGFKSMHLVSVGWSLDGHEIPPYMQSADSYIGYNANSPEPDHVSAGKLFLGKYAFDAATCSEVYYQGIEFNSRPSSLNGFYKYLPDARQDTDLGLVVVELLNDKGDETHVIAHSEMKLDASPDFVSFNLPITYTIPNLKATRLKIMFASSDAAGSIEKEDTEVPVSPDVEHARFVGSELWIDNLSFTY